MGDVGTGCGRSRGFRWLDLCDSCEASLPGCTADAGRDVGAFARLPGSRTAIRVGSLDRERAAGDGAMAPPGVRSNFSASAFTLAVPGGGGERVVDIEDAGPETERALGRGIERAVPFTEGWRWRVDAMSTGSRAGSWSAERIL